MHRLNRPCLDLAISMAVAAALCPGQQCLQKRPTNFVFFLVDDLGYMDVGANNPQCFYDTPNVDRLAESGMRFTNGYAACPVCSPTRLSIMTGKYPSRTDATNWFSGKRAERFAPAPLHDRMDLEEVTLAEALEGTRLRHLFRRQMAFGPDRGVLAGTSGLRCEQGRLEARRAVRPGQVLRALRQPAIEGRAAGRTPARSSGPRNVPSSSTNHKQGPFLAYLSFYSVHTPLVARADLKKKYQAKAEGLGLLEKPQFAEEEQNFLSRPPSQGADRTEPRGLRRHGRSNGPGGWQGARPARPARLDSEHGRLLHVGQRRAVNERRVANVQPAAARRQGLALRRRDPRTAPDSMAGRDQALERPAMCR